SEGALSSSNPLLRLQALLGAQGMNALRKGSVIGLPKLKPLPSRDPETTPPMSAKKHENEIDASPRSGISTAHPSKFSEINMVSNDEAEGEFALEPFS